MAEKGIVVVDAITGESIACRDAIELDDDSNARLIQRVDVCKGKIGPLPTPENYTDSGYRYKTVIDSKNLYDFPAAAIFPVGDKSTLIVNVWFEADLTQSVGITPIIFTDDVTPVPAGVLETKSFSMTSGSALQMGDTLGSGSSNSWPGEGTTGYYATRQQSWDVEGAINIGLHVTSYSQAGVAWFIAWGQVI